MKSFKLAILFTALAMAGCGDKNDADTAQQTEGTLLEQAKEATSSAVDSAQQAADSAGQAMSDAADAAQEEASAAADQMAETADAGMEAAGDMADQAAAAAGDAMDAGQEMAADAAAATEEAVTAAGDAASETADEATAAAVAAVGMAPAAGADATAGYDLEQGKSVYTGKCQACHATGAAGAPKMGDTANWAPRIAQGMDTLFKHSIEGFKGSVGYMPPKGGFTSLSDDEVKAAVAYMVSENQ